MPRQADVWDRMGQGGRVSARASKKESPYADHGATFTVIGGLGARVHLFVRPEYRERFTGLFRDVLECDVRTLDFGLPLPILLVSFPDASAFSVEFTDAAAEEPCDGDYARALRGAWLEFRTDDVPAVQQKLHHAGIRSFAHPASSHVYFSAPGGQVFRIIDVGYRGP